MLTCQLQHAFVLKGSGHPCLFALSSVRSLCCCWCCCCCCSPPFVPCKKIKAGVPEISCVLFCHSFFKVLLRKICWKVLSCQLQNASCLKGSGQPFCLGSFLSLCCCSPPFVPRKQKTRVGYLKLACSLYIYTCL